MYEMLGRKVKEFIVLKLIQKTKAHLLISQSQKIKMMDIIPP